MAVRLKDIAKLAQTSEATVSLVLNGRHRNRVSETMQDRIRKIAEELGYQPNRQAQLLASGKTHAVGVLVNTLTNSFFSRYIGLLEDRLAEHDLHVIPAETRSEPDRMNTLFAMVSQRVADAVISLTDRFENVGANRSEDRIISRLETFPSQATAPDPSPTVLVDYEPATTAMFAEFSKHGARRIALVMATQHDPMADKPTPRARAFLAISSETGASEARIAVVDETAPFRVWYETTRELLEGDSGIDALFFHNAHVAPPVLRAIEDAGRRTGKDLAVATYDDPEFATWLGPGLSVVREPADLVADTLTETVLDALTGQDATKTRRVLSAEYRSRASSKLG